MKEKKILEDLIVELWSMIIRCKCGSKNFEQGYEGEASCVDCRGGKNGLNDIDITSHTMGYNQSIQNIIFLLQSKIDKL